MGEYQDKNTITTGGAGYVPNGQNALDYIRGRLYKNIQPIGYSSPLTRIVDAVIKDENEHDNYNDVQPYSHTLDDLWAEYLQIPKEKRRYNKITDNGDGSFSVPYSSMQDILMSVNSDHPLKVGESSTSLNTLLGRYHVRRGYDDKGDYLEYYDPAWDVNPYSNTALEDYGGSENSKILKKIFGNMDDISFGIGKPFKVKGRYYLNDIYGINEKNNGTWLPEVNVFGKSNEYKLFDLLKNKNFRKTLRSVEQFKKGNKIHIKKENRGKFTDYCGGKVTSECIAKGKSSPNPAIRKRATFAANARKWKHQSGGQIIQEFKVKKAQEGTKFDIAGLLSEGATTLMQNSQQRNQINSDFAQRISNTQEQWNDFVNGLIQKNKQDREAYFQNWAQDYMSGKTLDNPSNIVANYIGNKKYNEEYALGKQRFDNMTKSLENQKRIAQDNNLMNTITSLVQVGAKYGMNYLASKNNNNSSTTQ